MAAAIGTTASAAVQGLLQHAQKLLATRPHSVRELQQKLTHLCVRRKGAARASLRAEYAGVNCTAAASHVVEQLTSQGALDDGAYAKWHVEQRQRFRPRSHLQLLQELSAKGLPQPAVRAAMAGFNELEAARELARRRSALDDTALLKHLANKGFSANVAMQVVRERRANTLDATRNGDDEAMIQ